MDFIGLEGQCSLPLFQVWRGQNGRKASLWDMNEHNRGPLGRFKSFSIIDLLEGMQ